MQNQRVLLHFLGTQQEKLELCKHKYTAEGVPNCCLHYPLFSLVFQRCGAVGNTCKGLWSLSTQLTFFSRALAWGQRSRAGVFPQNSFLV